MAHIQTLSLALGRPLTVVPQVTSAHSCRACKPGTHCCTCSNPESCIWPLTCPNPHSCPARYVCVHARMRRQVQGGSTFRLPGHRSVSSLAYSAIWWFR